MDLIDKLETARAERRRAEERVADIGEDKLRDLREAHQELTTLLGRYEERATGSGDFQAFVEFQGALSDLVENLPDDLPERAVFESIDERLQQRRLSERDFESARDDLAPVEDLIARLDERREAGTRVERLEGRVRDAIHRTHQEIDRLETVKSLGDADLDAPIENLRDPIESYNESVQEAFGTFRDTEPARAVVGLVVTAQQYPLLDVPEPPTDLYEFLESAEAGSKPIPTVLEYTEFSRSKLSHYVDAPATFQRLVGGNRTYLERLDADPYTIEWPPPAPEALRWRADELVSMLNRFAPPETIAALDTVRELARDEDRYRRLRRAARARIELTDEERERLAEGAVEADLADARDRLAALEAVLNG